MDGTALMIMILIGLIGGILSGMLGIGGGIIIVPALVFFLGMTQKTAQGTTLAMMLPPVAILGVLSYWQKGLIDWRVALVMAGGFLVGGYLGGRFAVWLPDELTLGSWEIRDPMKKIFAVAMIAIAIKILLEK